MATNYTLDLAAGLTQVLDDGTNIYLYGNGRITQAGSTTEYFLGDALGSVRQLVDTNGAVTLTQSYAPYGETVSSVGSGYSAYQYTGESRDPNGLTYLRARYYAPQDGRFISRDTWAGDYNRPLSLNKWNYVEANPIIFVDPSGFSPILGGIDDLPVTLLDPRSLGYVAGQNVDLLPYLFYLNPYDFNFTSSVRYNLQNPLAEQAVSILARKFSDVVGQGGIPNALGDENYPTKFIIEALDGETFWRRLIEVNGTTQNMFSAWFVVNSVYGQKMVAETFPLNSPYENIDIRTTVYLEAITQGNNKKIGVG